jgi:hypothetical protein
MKHKPKQNKSCLCPEYNVIKLVPHSTIWNCILLRNTVLGRLLKSHSLALIVAKV